MLLQAAGSGEQRGSCRAHVVYQQDPGLWGDLGSERAAHVLGACFAGKPGLGRCVANAA
jgi:hypothetical protein